MIFFVLKILENKYLFSQLPRFRKGIGRTPTKLIFLYKISVLYCRMSFDINVIENIVSIYFNVN